MRRGVAQRALKNHYSGYKKIYKIFNMNIMPYGILDTTVICQMIDMARNQEYLEKHKYKLYQNKDGRWCTYLPDRKRLQRGSKESLEEALINYYKNAEYSPTVKEIFNEWNSRRVTLGKITAGRGRSDYVCISISVDRLLPVFFFREKFLL